jgi:hypothetical protein
MAVKPTKLAHTATAIEHRNDLLWFCFFIYLLWLTLFVVRQFQINHRIDRRGFKTPNLPYLG